MTLPLPLYDGTPETLQFILDQIAQAIEDTGGRQTKRRFGISTVTFTASTSSSVRTVTHGMGSTPANVQITPMQVVSQSAPTVLNTVGATTFQVQLFEVTTTARTGTETFFWEALG